MSFREQYSLSGASQSGFGGQSFSTGFSSVGGASFGGASFSAGASSGAASGSVNSIAQDLLELIGGSGSSSSASFSASAGAGASAVGSGAFVSEIEAAILRSTNPITINETEEITAAGQRGIWANKQEVVNWKGVIPITEYIINEDSNPEIVNKKVTQTLEYIQELAIRYLRPPTPPAPGEIVITQEANTLTPPAPPLVIRQQPARPDTPEPLVVREAPPQPPAQVGRKVITISGKRLPPPARKVVIERLAPLPSKPQSVIIERWLPYSEVKRRVIFNKSNQVDAVAVKPRNVIVQWQAPQVNIKKEYKYLGVIRANPVEYVRQYGASLKVSRDLPSFVLDIKTPEGLVLAADYKYNSLHELEGEVSALKLVDLDKEGLSEYKEYLRKLGFTASSAGGASSAFAGAASASASASASSASSSSSSELIAKLFKSVDRENNGRITVEDAEKTVLRLNSRLGRQYGEDDVRAFFSALDNNGDGSLDLEEFTKAFLSLIG